MTIELDLLTTIVFGICLITMLPVTVLLWAMGFRLVIDLIRGEK